MSGDRWGIEGPPEEAYSRVTNPERFQPLHAAAMELLDRLEREFAVERLEGPDADDELGRKSLARPAIRLTPHDPQAAPIVVAFSEFPGLHIRFGSWRTEPFPNCGCDACDETADGLIEEMTQMVEAVVSGGFREAVRTPPLLGRGWQESEFRTGCKLVCLDRQVRLLHHDTVYPLLGGLGEQEVAKKVDQLCGQYHVEAIAVGNGTGGRETEAFLRRLELGPRIAVVMVNESRASVYSASEVARAEPVDDISLQRQPQGLGMVGALFNVKTILLARPLRRGVARYCQEEFQPSR